jgi:Fimbrial assembly protein (PilN)
MSTSLMPLDPALSPQQVSRLLPIRADLLPAEITARRTARRMRTVVVAGVALIVVALGGWYADAYHDYSSAVDDRDAVNTQIADATRETHRQDLAQVTATIKENGEVTGQLKTLMTNDLQWSTLINRLRATGAESHVTITRITASLADAKSATTTALAGSTGTTVATLTIEGGGADKNTIAGFIDHLGRTPSIANPYLTTANQGSEQKSGYSFTASADVTSVALCGRFTTPCSGGK